MSALLIALSLALAPRAQDPVPFLDRAALVIDGVVVSWADFGAYLVREQGGKQARAFANHLSIERAAREAGLTIGAEEIEARAHAEIEARVRGAFAGDRRAWQAELSKVGTSEAHWLVVRRAELQDELRLEHLVQAQRVIRDDEVHALWEQRHGPEGRTIHVRALRLNYSVASAEGQSDTEDRRRRERAVQDELIQRLQTLRARVLSGEDFDALARSEGQDAEAATGSGAWSAPFQWELWPAEVREALRTLPEGSVSAALYGRGCFNLFRIVDEQRTPLESVAPALREELRTRPVEGYEAEAILGALGSRETVEVLPALASLSADPDEPVLRVGEHDFTRAEYLAWLAPRIASREALPFVRLVLAERELSRIGLVITPEDVAQRIDEEIVSLVERAHDGDFAGWRAELAMRGMDETRLRRNLVPRTRLDLSAEAILRARRTVTDEDVRALHEERYGTDGRRLDLRVLRKSIRLPPESSRATAEERDAEHRAAALEMGSELRRLRERALAGGEDFGALARTASDEPESRDLGGRYAGGFPWRRFPPGVREELRAMQPGEIVGPLEIGTTLWLFELAGAESVTLASVSEELRVELLSRAPTPLECARYLDDLEAGCVWMLDLSALGG